jgi:BirA family transcriptional regulator, biotin operon repressor / biotin---[acetyl-CoA-carboxylase] ligase
VTLDGVPGSMLARRWGVPHAAVFATLSSTLDVVHDLGLRGTPHGATVIAEEQTAGRGRDGRTWRSPVGGVWLGMLLRPGHVELGALSVRVGLVVADVVDELLETPAARLKWPNDVLLGDRKLAGVLCETRWQGESPEWLALGVGINACNDIPAEFAARAVALHEFVPGLRRVDVLDRLVPALAAAATARPTLTEAECRAFAERDWLRGRELRAPAGGRARGLTPDGALLVDLGTDTVTVREGHVELV